ncbi:PQQ-dependent sugar dehydrogenase [Glycomyces arizonensis]|uniref:PQQ-dependent sugar dehydrogenase n=1 Tax=Glycomyces arizonensis TaxID=256035 RepID=UPI0004025508|nr:PQQ-dependent sugar dehydrogenase [Glycomyces arizonensis]
MEAARSRPRRLTTVAAASGVLAAGAVAVVAANPAHAAACESIEYTVVNDWGSGHQAAVSLTAGTDSVDGWTLSFDLPGGAAVQSAWNVDWDQAGATFTGSDVGWNATVQAGQSRELFGMIVSGSGAQPESFTLNGVECGGEGEETPTDEPDPTQVGAGLVQVASGSMPTAGTVGPGGDLWIANRTGTIQVLGDDGLSDPVLDISDETTTDGERGLLGIAFDPSFAHFYISYTDLDGDTAIEEFDMQGDQLRLDTRRTVLTQEQPFSNHNGGHIAFGPDGMLYIGLGDGGSSFDPNDNAQNLGTLLGKLLRIDPSGADPYAIPPDNPFVDDPNARGEIWAYGLRNPWRFSWDAATGDLYIGDVGQNEREEIDVAPASSAGGENYGWARMEGTLPVSGQEPANHRPPWFEFDHAGGACSVTGGFVYRGSAIPDLRGAYVFSDYCLGVVRALTIDDDGAVGEEIEFSGRIGAGSIVSFVEGPDGELYVLSLGGAILRFEPE